MGLHQTTKLPPKVMKCQDPWDRTWHRSLQASGVFEGLCSSLESCKGFQAQDPWSSGRSQGRGVRGESQGFLSHDRTGVWTAGMGRAIWLKFDQSSGPFWKQFLSLILLSVFIFHHSSRLLSFTPFFLPASNLVFNFCPSPLRRAVNNYQCGSFFLKVCIYGYTIHSWCCFCSIISQWVVFILIYH